MRTLVLLFLLGAAHAMEEMAKTMVYHNSPAVLSCVAEEAFSQLASICRSPKDKELKAIVERNVHAPGGLMDRVYADEDVIVADALVHCFQGSEGVVEAVARRIAASGSVAQWVHLPRVAVQLLASGANNTLFESFKKALGCPALTDAVQLEQQLQNMKERNSNASPDSSIAHKNEFDAVFAAVKTKKLGDYQNNARILRQSMPVMYSSMAFRVMWAILNNDKADAALVKSLFALGGSTAGPWAKVAVPFLQDYHDCANMPHVVAAACTDPQRFSVPRNGSSMLAELMWSAHSAQNSPIANACFTGSSSSSTLGIFARSVAAHHDVLDLRTDEQTSNEDYPFGVLACAARSHAAAGRVGLVPFECLEVRKAMVSDARPSVQAVILCLYYAQAHCLSERLQHDFKTLDAQDEEVIAGTFLHACTLGHGGGARRDALAACASVLFGLRPALYWSLLRRAPSISYVLTPRLQVALAITCLLVAACAILILAAFTRQVCCGGRSRRGATHVWADAPAEGLQPGSSPAPSVGGLDGDISDEKRAALQAKARMQSEFRQSALVTVEPEAGVEVRVDCGSSSDDRPAGEAPCPNSEA